jgi:peptidoglycan/xylan/chitin deacetylase (PgdA/CDA1 family)
MQGFMSCPIKESNSFDSERKVNYAAYLLKKCAARAFAGLHVDSVLNSILENCVYRNSLEFAGLRFARRFQIIVLHKVSTDHHPFFKPLPPDDFENQLVFLKRFYCVLPLTELVDRSAKRDLPLRSVAITFDDGYRDNYEYAFPLLKKHKIRATIFLTTRAIGNNLVLWHDRIFDALRFTQKSHVKLSALQNCELQLHTEKAKVNALAAILSCAKRSMPEERLHLIEELESELAPNIAKELRTPMLSWDQVREMHGMGIDFGSHTVTHAIVSKLDERQLRIELAESKLEIENQIREPINLFAYPNGSQADFNDEAKAMLKGLGYRAAVTTMRGFNTCFQDPLELKRGQPWQHDMEQFRMSFFLQRHGFVS